MDFGLSQVGYKQFQKDRDTLTKLRNAYNKLQQTERLTITEPTDKMERAETSIQRWSREIQEHNNKFRQRFLDLIEDEKKQRQDKINNYLSAVKNYNVHITKQKRKEIGLTPKQLAALINIQDHARKMLQMYDNIPKSSFPELDQGEFEIEEQKITVPEVIIPPLTVELKNSSHLVFVLDGQQPIQQQEVHQDIPRSIPLTSAPIKPKPIAPPPPELKVRATCEVIEDELARTRRLAQEDIKRKEREREQEEEDKKQRALEEYRRQKEIQEEADRKRQDEKRRMELEGKPASKVHFNTKLSEEEEEDMIDPWDLDGMTEQAKESYVRCNARAGMKVPDQFKKYLAVLPASAPPAQPKKPIKRTAGQISTINGLAAQKYGAPSDE